MRAGSINGQNFMSSDVCAPVFQGWNNHFGRVVRHEHTNKHTNWPFGGENTPLSGFCHFLRFSAIFTVSYALFVFSRKASRAFFRTVATHNPQAAKFRFPTLRNNDAKTIPVRSKYMFPRVRHIVLKLWQAFLTTSLYGSPNNTKVRWASSPLKTQSYQHG